MPRRKKTKRNTKSVTRLNTYRRIKRLSDPISLIKSTIKTNLKRKLREYINPKQPINKNKTFEIRNGKPLLISKHYKRRKLSCKERLKLNDRARRTNFFKARAGGGSARPEHNRKHRRKC